MSVNPVIETRIKIHNYNFLTIYNINITIGMYVCIYKVTYDLFGWSYLVLQLPKNFLAYMDNKDTHCCYLE